MGGLFAAVGCLGALIALTSCSSATEDDSKGVAVQVERDVKVSDTPLGDVIVDDLNQGDRVTALCLVPRAQSSGGFTGSAVKLQTGSHTGYAAVIDFPVDPTNRQFVFDLDIEALQKNLPTCPD